MSAGATAEGAHSPRGCPREPFQFSMFAASSRFQRTIEDFECSRCACRVRGNGYTNHCPECLWSRHVDVNPGDRLNACRGLMRPVGLDQKRGRWVILHRCELCGTTRRITAAAADRFDALLSLAAKH